MINDNDYNKNSNDTNNVYKARELAAKQAESGSPIPSPMASTEVPSPKETKTKSRN